MFLDEDWHWQVVFCVLARGLLSTFLNFFNLLRNLLKFPERLSFFNILEGPLNEISQGTRKTLIPRGTKCLVPDFSLQLLNRQFENSKYNISESIEITTVTVNEDDICRNNINRSEAHSLWKNWQQRSSLVGRLYKNKQFGLV